MFNLFKDLLQYQPGDLVQFKEKETDEWKDGTVREPYSDEHRLQLDAHEILVEPDDGGELVIIKNLGMIRSRGNQ